MYRIKKRNRESDDANIYAILYIGKLNLKLNQHQLLQSYIKQKF